jgi:hypothetical protein
MLLDEHQTSKGGSVMTLLTLTTDEKARINLPKSFANSTVLIEEVSDTELRIRKARVIPEDDLPFVEETIAPLSDRDRDVFLALLDNPPPPNENLRRLLTSRPASQNQGDTDNGNQSAQSGDLGSLSWPDYFARVRAELYPPDYPLMQERLQVIREIRNLFAEKTHFCDLDYLGRRKIAGLVKSANPNFLLFGSMRWVGKFKQAIKDNNKQVSLALDEIPLDGNISRDQYQRFTDRFLNAFERSGMALASRLLAMKRPDMFVCINNQNREGLFQAFRVSPSRDADSYWDLIEKVRACAWWKAPAPRAGDELEVWKARAAFLDALFYTGVGFEVGSD